MYKRFCTRRRLSLSAWATNAMKDNVDETQDTNNDNESDHNTNGSPVE